MMINQLTNFAKQSALLILMAMLITLISNYKPAEVKAAEDQRITDITTRVKSESVIIIEKESPSEETQKIEVESKWLKQVRYFEHPDKVRLVPDTFDTSLSKYSASSTDNGLLIHLGDISTTPPKTAIVPAVAPTDKPAEAEKQQPIAANKEAIEPEPVAATTIDSETTHSEMGVFMIGAKGWYAFWDSAVLDWFEKDIGAGFRELGLSLDSDINTGTGYLAGPLLGYQTADGTWAFGIAAMVFSSFSQDWEGTAGQMQLETDIDTNRWDLDFSITYSLSRHQDIWSFFKYSRLFAGFKFQKVDYDLELEYDTLMGRRRFDYTLDAQVYMPTFGAGLVFPILDNFAFGLQAGVGMALIELELKRPDGEKYDIDPNSSIAYNGEATLTYAPIEHLLLQLGFRAQAWYLEARNPGRFDKTESRDLTYGPTLSLVFAF